MPNPTTTTTTELIAVRRDSTELEFMLDPPTVELSVQEKESVTMTLNAVDV